MAQTGAHCADRALAWSLVLGLALLIAACPVSAQAQAPVVAPRAFLEGLKYEIRGATRVALAPPGTTRLAQTVFAPAALLDDVELRGSSQSRTTLIFESRGSEYFSVSGETHLLNRN